MLNVRIKTKHDTTANWDKVLSFIPLAGEIIIYDDYSSITVDDNGTPVTRYIPALKVGDGKTYLVDLPFINDDVRNNLLQHINDTNVHVTPEQKQHWNNKVNIDDAYDILYDELEDETLVFNRN